MPSPKQIRYDPTNDLYKILGVSSSSTIEEIHRAYRNRAKEVHPDLNPERAEWANGQFQHLNTAHDILGNVTKRRDYDQKRHLYLDSRSADPRSTPLAKASRAAWKKRNRKQPQWYLLFQVSLGLVCVGSVFLFIHPAPSSDAAAPPSVDQSIVNSDVAALSPTVAWAESNLTAIARSSTSPACADPNVVITEPSEGASVEAPFTVTGTAVGKDFVSYTLEITAHHPIGVFQHAPYDWIPLISNSIPVENQSLAPKGDSPLVQESDGRYVLRLTAYYQLGGSSDSLRASSCDVAFQVKGHSNAVAQDSVK